MDHSQRGFAYVCFENQEDAKKAAANDANSYNFEQKESRNTVGKLINNLYFKNIPDNMTNDQVNEMFAPFGSIKSLVVLKGDIGKYGFVCYMDPTGKDNTYGPNCVNKAIEALMNREMTPGPDGLKLYVRHALNKSQRE
jgi:RNA recognition motif-containing protein